MKRMLPIVLVLPLLIVGCSKLKPKPDMKGAPPDEMTAENREKGIRKYVPILDRTLIGQQLGELGKLYQQHTISTSMPPSGPNDLQLARDLGKVNKAIADGNYVVYWGVDNRKLDSGASNTVLAYSKDTVDSGGPVVVLLADYSLQQSMPLGEFNKLAKPGN